MSPRPGAPLFEAGAGVYIIAPDRRLLLAEQERRGMRKWGSFGGGIEHGESIQECAVREAYEESGLRVRLDRLLVVTEFWAEGRFDGIGFLFLASPDPWPQQVVLPEVDGENRFLRHGWFARDQLAALDMYDDEPCRSCWPADEMPPRLVRWQLG
jgi:8-oxo-dGTP pyrophosphatase MutT (NUDIX family)